MPAHKKTNRKPKSSRGRNRRLPRAQANKLNFETLEPKHLLAAITVSNATEVLSPTANTSSIANLIANDGGDGISLREAITATNNQTGADTITFDRSVFTGGNNNVIRLTQSEFVINDSVSIDGTSVGGVVITGDVQNDDVTLPGTDITDVSASFGNTAGAADDLLDDNTRVLNFSAITGNLTLTNLTITGGRTTGDFEEGGGIRSNSSGTLTLNHSTVSGNSTTGSDAYGGGIRTDSGNVFLTHSTISGNSSTGIRAEGGGIRTNSGGVSLTNSTVSENSSSNDGGGIRTNSGDVFLTDSTVSGNSITGSYAYGGGISTESGNVSLTNSTVSGNSSDAVGGGIYAGSESVIFDQQHAQRQQQQRRWRWNLHGFW